LEKVKFLGHVISKGGVPIGPTKVDAILQWESLEALTEVLRFLELEGYCSRFIEGFLE